MACLMKGLPPQTCCAVFACVEMNFLKVLTCQFDFFLHNSLLFYFLILLLCWEPDLVVCVLGMINCALFDIDFLY